LTLYRHLTKKEKESEFLVLGSTGMLGQSLVKAIKRQKRTVTGVARHKADICIDITDDSILLEVLDTIQPKIVINTVAIVNLLECERSPCLSYIYNSRVSGVLSRYCSKNKIKYVYISTDHFFTGSGGSKHSEEAAVNLSNEYAVSKYLGERLSLVNREALVVRTNIVGFRHKKGSPTFVEWVIQSLKEKEHINMFDDFYTSSIDVVSFSGHLLDLIDKEIKGVINLASSEVSNKEQFISRLAKELNLSLERASVGSMKKLSNDNIYRNESLGLDVAKVEKVLGLSMPSLQEVIANLIIEYRKEVV